MSLVSTFLDGCRAWFAEHHEGSSFDDCMTRSRILEYHARKSMAAQCGRAFTDPKSGYADMPGTVIFPSPGMRAAWTKGITPMANKLSPPDFARNSVILSETIGRTIEKNNFKGPGASLRLVSAQNALVSVSKRKQEIVGMGFQAIGYELDLANMSLEQKEEMIEGLLADKVAHLELIRRQQTVIENLSGKSDGAVVPNGGGHK